MQNEIDVQEPENILIYFYGHETREYRGSAVADRSPLEPDVALLPLDATLEAPPLCGPHETAVWDDVSGTWSVQPDFRNVPLYKTSDGTPVSLDKIGVTPDEIDATEKPMPHGGSSFVDGDWVNDSVKFEAYMHSLKVHAYGEINGALGLLRIAVCGTTDPIEVASWSNKLRAAQAVVAGVATPAEIKSFEVELAMRKIPGETVQMLVDKVMLNGVQFGLASGRIDGISRAARDAIRDAKNPESLATVVAEYLQKINSFNAQ